MIRRTLLSLTLAAGFAFQAGAQEVVVKIAPPHAIVERRGPAPEAGFVWIDGYHKWDGRAYVWVPGRWERPPHPRDRWVAHKWVKRNGGWVLVEGRWK
jgi:hypothetical protein